MEMDEMRDFKALPVPVTNEIADTFPVVETKDLTMPETPCLESIQRHRDFKERAKEIRSIHDVEEKNKHEFKAKPIPNYAELGRIGVSRPEHKELCEPQSPQLQHVRNVRACVFIVQHTHCQINRISTTNTSPSHSNTTGTTSSSESSCDEEKDRGGDETDS
jgi:hypothetical protein